MFNHWFRSLFPGLNFRTPRRPFRGPTYGRHPNGSRGVRITRKDRSESKTRRKMAQASRRINRRK